jgi:4-hydroxy-2-oxoheptanedioate aldolase
VRLWGLDTAEYHARADVWPLDPDGELFVVAMVESAEAVGNIEDILAAPISAIMVVPGDMSIDLGLGPAPGPENHPEVDAMYEKVLAACKAQDRVICGCGDGAARLQQRIDEGWQFILPLGG